MTIDQALAPYRPGEDGPFGPAEAGHLLRRTQFGDPPARRDALVALGPHGAVDALLRPDDEDPGWQATLDVLAAVEDSDDLAVARASWLTRLARSPRPFGEVLTLFWHGHFATAVEKVGRVDLMTRQIATLRRRGRGPLGELLAAVSRDPAMIRWLDGNSNRRSHPNENYARELLELFALGEGHYGEADVLEAARAFSGWHERGGRFVFQRHEHDDGVKTVLGRTGRLDGDQVVEACLARPECGRHVAGALYRFFVHPEPDDGLLEVLGARYTELDHDTGAFLAELFRSRCFYDPAARFALVRSPVALAVGSARSLGLTWDATVMGERLADLGQGLLAPPGVRGWVGGHGWLNSATLLGRLRLADELSRRGGALGVRHPDGDLTLDGVLDALLDAQLPEAVRLRLDEDPLRALADVLSLPEAQLA